MMFLKKIGADWRGKRLIRKVCMKQAA
jgi:hypothetical protein